MEVFDAVIDAFSNDAFVEEMKDKMNAKVDTDKQEQEMKGLQDTQRQRIIEIEMIGKHRNALHHEDPMYEMKYDKLVAEEERKYNELHVVKEEIKRLDAKIRKEIKSTASYRDAVKEISDIILH